MHDRFLAILQGLSNDGLPELKAQQPAIAGYIAYLEDVDPDEVGTVEALDSCSVGAWFNLVPHPQR